MTVYCVGSINLDFIFKTATWPGEHEKRRAADYVCAAGGSAANTAAELARLGNKVQLVSGVGQDHLGELAVETLVQRGVGIDNVLRRPDWKTGCAAIRSFGSTKSILTAGTVDAAIVLDLLLSFPLETGDHVHFSWPPPERLCDAIAGWRARSVSFSWESNGRGITTAASLMDVLFMNQEERVQYLLALGRRTLAFGTPEDSVTLVVTLGPKGAEAFLNGKRHFQAAMPVAVIDRTGGGDAFDAGFLNAWLNKQDLDACLIKGLESAATIIGQFGSQSRGL